MRLLIFLLALLSAFFVSADEPDLSDLIAPKSTITNWVGTSYLDGFSALAEGNSQLVAMDACSSQYLLVQQRYQARYSS